MSEGTVKSEGAVKLSIVIPCFNAASTIAEQLDALAVQEWDESWEVVVADNGSDDGTLAVVEGYLGVLPSLTVVDASARGGSAYARNVGVKAASGEFIAFCDADDVVAPGWLAAIGGALEEHPFVASRFDTERLNSPLLQKTRMNNQATGLRSYTYPEYLPHAGGCGLGVRRAVHELIGGFDESMMRLEDTDYCWRIQLAGIPLYFAADALMHIRFREGLRDSFRQAFLYG